MATFAYEAYGYQLPLCREHGDLFDLELGAWARLASRPHHQTLLDRARPVNVKIPVSVTDGGVVDHGSVVSKYPGELPGEVVATWTFSERTVAWMDARGVSRADLLWVIVAKHHPDRGDDIVGPYRTYTHNGFRVVIDVDKQCILSASYEEVSSRGQ